MFHQKWLEVEKMIGGNGESTAEDSKSIPTKCRGVGLLWRISQETLIGEKTETSSMMFNAT
jgi:hypothetical protein